MGLRFLVEEGGVATRFWPLPTYLPPSEGPGGSFAHPPVSFIFFNSYFVRTIF